MAVPFVLNSYKYNILNKPWPLYANQDNPFQEEIEFDSVVMLTVLQFFNEILVDWFCSYYEMLAGFSITFAWKTRPRYFFFMFLASVYVAYAISETMIAQNEKPYFCETPLQGGRDLCTCDLSPKNLYGKYCAFLETHFENGTGTASFP